MFLQHLDLTTALRPVLVTDETLLFLQDGVGLYEGKYKIPDFQKGQVYLTSHRVCYVDHEKPREHSVAIYLQDVDHHEFYAGFLKSSPKVVLFPRHEKHPFRQVQSSGASQGLPPLAAHVNAKPLSPPPVRGGTWICPICSFSNPVPQNFDPITANSNTPIPPCLACGVLPSLAHVLKAAVAQSSQKQPSTTPPDPRRSTLDNGAQFGLDPPDDAVHKVNTLLAPQLRSAVSCPRCTFLNHPSLVSCEICGASLPASDRLNGSFDSASGSRSDSPVPSLAKPALGLTETPGSIKLSFRAGGEKPFYERFKSAMVQRKWLLHGAPPVPRPDQLPVSQVGYGRQGNSSTLVNDNLNAGVERMKIVGLAGLEQRGLRVRKNNEVVIGKAFEDLEALMAAAKEIAALAESFAGTISSPSAGGSLEAKALISQSATALGLVTTKDLLGSGSNAESLYLSELSRNLAEFLTDDTTGVLRREGGIMSLVDLWAVFNRARGGVELVSPLDFYKAACLWEKLNLTLRLRKFKSGLLVVQGKDRSDVKTISSLLRWLRELHWNGRIENPRWDYGTFGRGVTPQETAEKFGWSVGVASEELEMAEEAGALCREEGVEGPRFWENWFLNHDDLSTRIGVGAPL